MPDSRHRRGAHPRDRQCFAADQIATLRQACRELCWLLDRGYPPSASADLVGNRHRLRARQRKALQRCSATVSACLDRSAKQVATESLAGSSVSIDGYNVLLTLEAALAGGVILHARDETYRDMAAMSGHYRRVLETPRALDLLGRYLERHDIRPTFYFDRPVSNSGRLKRLMLEIAEARGWPWSVELVPNPDPILEASDEVVATADSGILDRTSRWWNLARSVIDDEVPGAWVVDLRSPVELE